MKNLKIQQIDNGYIVTTEEASMDLNKGPYNKKVFAFLTNIDLFDYLESFFDKIEKE